MSRSSPTAERPSPPRKHTLAAHDLALAQDADVLELDVRATADGELVVLHDRSLLRTAGDPRDVDLPAWRDVERLPAAQRPLRLEDVLATYGRSTQWLIGLKDPEPFWEATVPAAIARHGLAEQATVQSWAWSPASRPNALSLLVWAASSFVEGLVSMTIIWRFTGSRVHSATSEPMAQKWVAGSFLLLVPYFLYESFSRLLNGSDTEFSGLGAAVTSATVITPLLGWAKLLLSRQLGSDATAGEGIQKSSAPRKPLRLSLR